MNHKTTRMKTNNYYYDRLDRAQRAFAVAEVAHRNGLQRAGLPMLRAAAHLGLQALVSYYNPEPTSSLSLPDLLVLSEHFTLMGAAAFKSTTVRPGLLNDLDAVSDAHRESDYYRLSEKDIEQLVNAVRQLLENVAALAG